MLVSGCIVLLNAMGIARVGGTCEVGFGDRFSEYGRRSTTEGARRKEKRDMWVELQYYILGRLDSLCCLFPCLKFLGFGPCRICCLHQIVSFLPSTLQPSHVLVLNEATFRGFFVSLHLIEFFLQSRLSFMLSHHSRYDPDKRTSRRRGCKKYRTLRMWLSLELSRAELVSLRNRTTQSALFGGTTQQPFRYQAPCGDYSGLPPSWVS